MDAFFFKFLIEEIRSEIIGNYIRKIYSPKPKVFCFQLSSKKNLFFIFGKEKALFLSDHKMNNPDQPSKEVMFLRKEVGGSKITDLLEDWPNRNFCLKVKRKEKEKWIFFDLKKGIEVYDFLPINKKEILWPDVKTILNNNQIYTDYPHITPGLRKELKARSEEEAKELLSLLKRGSNEGFFLYEHESDFVPSVWKMTLFENKQEVKCKIFSSALDCAYEYGWSIFSKLGDEEAEEDIKREKEIKKIKRILKKLDEDEKRLKDLIKEGEKALLIQQNLYLFDPKAKYKSIEIDGKIIELDPSLSLLENMERMFNLAKKGKRGILKLDERRKELNTRLLELKESDTLNAEKDVKEIDLLNKDSSKSNGLRVQTYRTEDNFVIIRGKDKRANHLILSKLASPFDFWFHVEDGPGAHVILKRDHPNQEVPERSMIQAASIAAYFSYQRFSNKAYVMCALVKDVRKIKGAGLGKVKVEKVLKSFVVRPQSELIDQNNG